jgi:hypothetical protein
MVDLDELHGSYGRPPVSFEHRVTILNARPFQEKIDALMKTLGMSERGEHLKKGEHLNALKDLRELEGSAFEESLVSMRQRLGVMPTWT